MQQHLTITLAIFCLEPSTQWSSKALVEISQAHQWMHLNSQVSYFHCISLICVFNVIILNISILINLVAPVGPVLSSSAI